MNNNSLLAVLVCGFLVLAACDVVAITNDSPGDTSEAALHDEREVWQWKSGIGMRCRDGSETGFALRRGPSPNLLIMLDGGGVCFDAASCRRNAANYDEARFRAEIANTRRFETGVYATDHPGDNPFHNWNVVFVPYCTGDLHGGDATGVVVGGVAQQFVGYCNMRAMLDTVSVMFNVPARVVLAGISAGGGGVMTTYGLVVEHFEGVAGRPISVDFLSDAAPFAEADRVLTPELQQKWRMTWNLDTAIPDGCPNCSQPDGDGLENVIPYYAAQYPNNSFGITAYLQDCVVRGNLAALNDNDEPDAVCAMRPRNPFPEFVPRPDFRAGLTGIRQGLVAYGLSNAGTYFSGGFVHGLIGGDQFYSTTVRGVKLSDWVADLLNGDLSHVYP